jgi:predicted lipoprotein with Yx(FWY)xxD motif
MKSRVVIAAAVFTGLLAACGSSHSAKSSNNPSSSAPAPNPSGPAAAPTGAPAVVKTANNSQFGTILVDTNGATLYTLTNSGKAVACTSSACVAAWPPLLLPAGVTSATGAGVAGLGTASVPGGTIVTHDGLPLYRFINDSAPGQATGEGIANFGGVWHVVKVSASSSSSGSGTAPAPAPAGGSTGSTGSSGSGY